MTLPDIVKIVLCAQVSRVHMAFYIFIKGSTVPRNRVHMTSLTRSVVTFIVFSSKYNERGKLA